jgi:flagellar assembly protein FliH
MTQVLQLCQPLRAVLSPDEEARQREMERRIRAAEQAAYERGRRETEESYRRQLQEQAAEFEQREASVLRSLQQAVPEVIHVTENSLVALTLEVAQRLIAGLPIQPEMVEAVVREAVGQTEAGSELTVHLHPDDYRLLQEAKSALLTPTPGGAQLRFQTSTEVARGGCLVQTRFGVIDACRETKLALLKKTLLP